MEPHRVRGHGPGRDERTAQQNLQTSGCTTVQDILIAVVDGLKGFPQAIEAAFPRTQVQTASPRPAWSTFCAIP